MDQSQPCDSSMAVKLHSVRRRSLSQSQRQQYLESLDYHRLDERSCVATDNICNNCVSVASSSMYHVSPDDQGAPSGFASIAPYAYRLDRRQATRAQAMVLLVAASVLLLCNTSMVTCAHASTFHQNKFRSSRMHLALFVANNNYRHGVIINPSMSIQRKTPQRSRSNFNVDTTWSNAVRQKSELNESRFGVRKRVQTVLDKAKKRTGIDNSSTVTDRENWESSFVQSGPNIVAEAASIGGLEPVVIDEKGNVDVALGYISKEDSSGGANIEASDENYDYPAILARLSEDGVKQTSESSPDVPSMSSTSLHQPEDDFVLLQGNNVKTSKDTTQNTRVEKETPKGDTSVASSTPREPLPFSLPKLSPEQSRRVINGDRVQFQDDMGRAGSGFVVCDVKAPASVVWDCLLDFQSYPQTIPTVREVVMYTNTHLKEDYRAEKPLDYEDGTVAICKHGVPSVTRAQFSLSKFRLKIAAVHKYRPHPRGDYMIFTLDPASTNMVLKYAKGIWYTESNPDGKEGHTRVWLLCELRVSRLLPQWIVDYAAARAMPRATTWLKPQTEAAAMLWLKDEI
ncbi:hypothetical protein ACHAXH_007027 [Discostella pseudostelligera]|jgi:hypothetical protein